MSSTSFFDGIGAPLFVLENLGDDDLPNFKRSEGEPFLLDLGLGELGWVPSTQKGRHTEKEKRKGKKERKRERDSKTKRQMDRQADRQTDRWMNE